MGAIVLAPPGFRPGRARTGDFRKPCCTNSAGGRPSKLVRMATNSSAVIGVVIDADTCCVTVTGLDGRVTEERTLRFPTPDDYSVLIDRLEDRCHTLLSRSSAGSRCERARPRQ